MNSSPFAKQCWVVPTDRGGGVVWVADSCCRQAQAEGLESVLLSLEDVSHATIERMTYSYATLSGKFPYLNSRTDFLRWINHSRPDIVFINNVDNLDACIPYVPADVRLVYVVHDTMSFYWKQALRHESSLDAIVAVSEETGSRFRDQLSDPSKLTVIQNGTVFPPLGAGGASEERRDLMFLGGDDPRKGCDDVLAVWAELVRQGYDGRLHWFSRISDMYRQVIDRSPARDRIVLHGHVTRQQVFSQMEQSAVLLLPSRAEACSISALEALAMGCALVAWDIAGTGIREIVVADEHRFLSPLGDCAAMARQVFKALSQRDVIGDGMSAWARSQFAESRMWGDYRALLAKIAEQPLAQRPMVGETVPPYRPPRRATHYVPDFIWKHLRPMIARSGKAYYFLRNKL